MKVTTRNYCLSRTDSRDSKTSSMILKLISTRYEYRTLIMFRFKTLKSFRIVICQIRFKVFHRSSLLPNLTERASLSTRSCLLLTETTLNRALRRVSSSPSNNALPSLRPLIRLAASSHRLTRAKSKLSRPEARVLLQKRTAPRMCLKLVETITKVLPMPVQLVKVTRVTRTQTQSSTTSAFRTNTLRSSTLTRSTKSC